MCTRRKNLFSEKDIHQFVKPYKNHCLDLGERRGGRRKKRNMGRGEKKGAKDKESERKQQKQE